MYQMDSRVRYSECTVTGELSLTALLDYLQDCCTFQSEELGVGVEFLTNYHMAWLLSSWQVDIIRYPKLGEKIRIFTWPYEFKGFYGKRNFKIEDEQGTVILKADSIWIYMDMQSGKPSRPLPEVQAAYTIEPSQEMEYLGRKLPSMPAGEKKKTFTVPHYFIDTNRHVNNAKYVLMAEEFLPEGYRVNRVRAEYKKAAVLGDVICPEVCCGEDGIYVHLANEAGETYANVIFS
ncbi:MAG: thioesterase [bacterium]|nr:thioesterase [bacterium]